ncbi:MAG: hypothetical protein Ct9H300mP8_09170 [Gammaproteobacteria bacterium]|nr:MAG: hypothetical protein Ct9H300mP8_09170 [Gammaproteobacteria bacterium]
MKSWSIAHRKKGFLEGQVFHYQKTLHTVGVNCCQAPLRRSRASVLFGASDVEGEIRKNQGVRRAVITADLGVTVTCFHTMGKPKGPHGFMGLGGSRNRRRVDLAKR